MYYIIYGILYLVSLLPFFILYRISDLAYMFAYYIVGYRKEVVMENLAIAFPEKSIKERKDIAQKFYKNLLDTFIEMIKLFSLSEKQFFKRVELDLDECRALISKGLTIQFECGHQMNWEYGNHVFAKKLPIPFVAVYMRINNGIIDRIFYNQRKKYGAVLIEATSFGKTMHNILKKQHALALIADQNPGDPPTSYWLNFFGKPAPFIMGADKIARRNKAALIFVNLVKVKRGYYRYETNVITENASVFHEGEITRRYRDFLEESIRKQPHNYLWSHRRWKWAYKKEYERRWIDSESPAL